jgi:two-component system, sensor histidine kinase RegB
MLALPWLIQLRYLLLGGEAIVLAVAALAAHIELLLLPLSALLAAALISNLLFVRMSRALGARRAVGGILVADVVALTAGLALSGGPANPFTLLYLVQITLSAVVLSKPWTWSLGGLSIAGFGLLFFLHVPVPALEGHHAAGIFSVHLMGMWVAFIAAALLITVLVGKVSDVLRNHELELLRLQRLLGRQEKITSLAKLAAGAAHAMGTPLATIAIVAKELERYATETNPDLHLAAEAMLIRGEIERCGRILREMSAQGAELVGETPSAISVGTLLEELRNSFPKSQRSAIEIEAAPSRTVRLPVETTRQVMAALVKNAIEASPAGQPVQLSGNADEGVLRLIVRDSGAGMQPEVLQQVAEPFYTTKSPGQGMGLGTFLARTFAEEMGGALVFESIVNQGTIAILEIPLAN